MAHDMITELARRIAKSRDALGNSPATDVIIRQALAELDAALGRKATDEARRYARLEWLLVQILASQVTR